MRDQTHAVCGGDGDHDRRRGSVRLRWPTLRCSRRALRFCRRCTIIPRPQLNAALGRLAQRVVAHDLTTTPPRPALPPRVCCAPRFDLPPVALYSPGMGYLPDTRPPSPGCAGHGPASQSDSRRDTTSSGRTHLAAEFSAEPVAPRPSSYVGSIYLMCAGIFVAVRSLTRGVPRWAAAHLDRRDSRDTVHPHSDRVVDPIPSLPRFARDALRILPRTVQASSRHCGSAWCLGGKVSCTTELQRGSITFVGFGRSCDSLAGVSGSGRPADRVQGARFSVGKSFLGSGSNSTPGAFPPSIR